MGTSRIIKTAMSIALAAVLISGLFGAVLKANELEGEDAVVLDTVPEWLPEDFENEGGKVTGLSAAGKEKLKQRKDLKIPSTLSGGAVTIIIGAEAFKNVDIKGPLTLPDGLTRIERAAFENAGLTGELNFPSTVNWIEPRAFFGNKLTTVTLPDKIGPLGWEVFANNQIKKVNLGTLENIKGSRWSTELNYEINGLLSWGLFRNNRIEELVLPETSRLWGIGVGAFANNQIRDLHIPKNIHNIYRYGFYRNKQLKTLTFAPGYDAIQIDYMAFCECGIEGTLVLPDEANQFGGYAFARNKITKLMLPKNSVGYGYNSFAENPIEEIEQFRTKTWLFESAVFADTTTLKNVSFKHFHEDVDHLAYETFRNGKLKSLEIPAHINELRGNVFSGNAGWYDEVAQVALYRQDSVGNYVTDNAVVDGTNYVINPILVELQAVDSNGQAIPEKIVVKVKRTRRKTINGMTTTDLADIDITNQKKDTDNFKIGDELQIDLDSSAWQGYGLKTNLMPIILSPDKLKNVSYGDGYKVGYKKITICLEFKKVIPMTKLEPAKKVIPMTKLEPSKKVIPMTKLEPSIPNPKPEPEPEPKPKPETEPDAVPKPKPEPKPEVKQEPEIQPDPEPKPEDKNQEEIKNEIPDENPPKNKPFKPEVIINADKIKDKVVVDIINPEGIPLGKAEINKQNNTYTFIDDDRLPEGKAKINADNVLEILDEDIAQGKAELPKTAGLNRDVYWLAGIAFVTIGLLIRRKR